MVDSSSFEARLDYALRCHGLDNAGFARRVDPVKGQQMVRNWRQRGGIGKPSSSLVRKILPNASIEWINDGVGQPPEDARGPNSKGAAPVAVREDPSEPYLAPRSAQNAPDSSTGLPTDLSTARAADEIPQGYVRLKLLDGAGEMGHGAENVDFPEVIREMDLAEAQLRSLIGFLPRPGRLKLMTGRGISMEPLIKSGDVIIVDTGCQQFEGDGIYVINVGNGVQVKALQARGDGIYVVSANPIFPAYKASEGLVIGGKVHIRNRLERLD